MFVVDGWLFGCVDLVCWWLLIVLYCSGSLFVLFGLLILRLICYGLGLCGDFALYFAV